jgi:hypothetical protein
MPARLRPARLGWRPKVGSPVVLPNCHWLILPALFGVAIALGLDAKTNAAYPKGRL